MVLRVLPYVDGYVAADPLMPQIYYYGLQHVFDSSTLDQKGYH